MFDIVTPKVECISSSENYGRFTIEPLESGFGITLGNALRRVLLSSLPGAAVTWIEIEEVNHEFSTIPHVKEDTTEFLLNIKGIRLRSFSDRPGRLTLEVEGEGEVTAADIKPSADYEIVNPELHLATLDSPQAKLTVELNVERGKGYIPAGSSDGLSLGAIPVDAIFTPIRRVNYTLEPMRIGVDNYDRLVLEIWTDGTIAPAEALAQAADILARHFALITGVGKTPLRMGERQPLSTISIPLRLYETPIEELDLSVRAYNCLKRSGITKVGQILEMSEEELLRVRNFGMKSLEELKERLELRGFLAGSRLSSTGTTLPHRYGDDEEVPLLFEAAEREPIHEEPEEQGDEEQPLRRERD